MVAHRLRAGLFVLGLALAPTAEAQHAGEHVVVEAPVRRDSVIANGGWTARAPEAIAPGDPLAITLEALRPSMMPVELRLRVEGPGGRAVRSASYDPASEPVRPGCDPMPGDLHPCTREPPRGRATVVFPATVFASPGLYVVRMQVREGGRWSRATEGTVRVVSAPLIEAYRAHPDHSHGMASRSVVRATLVPASAPILLYRATFELGAHSIEFDVSEPISDVAPRYLADPRWSEIDCIRLAMALGSTVEQSGCEPGNARPTPPGAQAIVHRVWRSQDGRELTWVSRGRIVRLRSAAIGPDERVVAAHYLARLPADAGPDPPRPARSRVEPSVQRPARR